MELKITSEAVQRAAKKCSTAKEVLKELFPDVFKESEYCFDFSDKSGDILYYRINDDYKSINNDILIRNGGEFENKGFFLSRGLNWEIKKDKKDVQVLVGRRK